MPTRCKNFIHGVDFPTILSEGRKYKLVLVLERFGRRRGEVDAALNKFLAA